MPEKAQEKKGAVPPLRWGGGPPPPLPPPPPTAKGDKLVIWIYFLLQRLQPDHIHLLPQL